MSLPTEVGLVWIDLAQTLGQPIGDENWEIFFKRSLNGGTTWQDLRRLTTEAGYSYTPTLAWGDRLLGLWANRPVSGAPWQLRARVSTHKGWIWGRTVTVPTGTASAWQPTLVWDPARNRFYVVWTDYNSAVPDLRLSSSTNGTDWTRPVPVVTNPTGAIRRKPHMAFGDGRRYVAWEEQEVASGNWSVQTFELD
jgi:hypothetical protein